MRTGATPPAGSQLRLEAGCPAAQATKYETVRTLVAMAGPTVSTIRSTAQGRTASRAWTCMVWLRGSACGKTLSGPLVCTTTTRPSAGAAPGFVERHATAGAWPVVHQRVRCMDGAQAIHNAAYERIGRACGWVADPCFQACERRLRGGPSRPQAAGRDGRSGVVKRSVIQRRWGIGWGRGKCAAPQLLWNDKERFKLRRQDPMRKEDI